jgi:hypothetical protein
MCFIGSIAQSLETLFTVLTKQQEQDSVHRAIPTIRYSVNVYMKKAIGSNTSHVSIVSLIIQSGVCIDVLLPPTNGSDLIVGEVGGDIDYPRAAIPARP